MANGFGGSPFATVLGGFAQGMVERRRLEEERKQKEFENALRMAAEGRAKSAEGRAAELHPFDVEGARVGVERDQVGLEDTRGDVAFEKTGREASQALVAEIAADPNLTPVQKQLAIARTLQGEFPTETLDPYEGKSREQHLADLEEEALVKARGGRRGAPLKGEGEPRKTPVEELRRTYRTNLQTLGNGQLQEELGKALQIRQLAAQGRAEPLTQEEIIILEELQREAERRQKGRAGAGDELDFGS